MTDRLFANSIIGISGLVIIGTARLIPAVIIGQPGDCVKRM